jgi:hypothetical protein
MANQEDDEKGKRASGGFSEQESQAMVHELGATWIEGVVRGMLPEGTQWREVPGAGRLPFVPLPEAARQALIDALLYCERGNPILAEAEFEIGNLLAAEPHNAFVISLRGAPAQKQRARLSACLV